MTRNILIIAEALILLVFILPILSGILNPGNIFGILLSLLFLSVTIFFDRFKLLISELFSGSIGKIIIIAGAVVMIAAVIYAGVLTAFMVHAQLKSPENAKAVVVLGCKVNGERPSRMLSRRLDGAYEFLKENQEVMCVVSGGKGDDEKISEALAMKRYLVDKGIDEDRIIMEDKSANTLENLKFSSELLREYGISDIAIVTDGFHQYRAGYIAEKFGLNVSAVNAKNDYLTIQLIPTYWVREWMAITKEYLTL
ncbi:MAG: YdcF family protein [Oscillospiraceae bacterium]|nr:YdcF family protein [Oscillospiraceae bacterium]